MRFVPSRLGLFDDVFDDVFQDSFFRGSNAVMKTDIREKDGNYLLDIELPGFKKEDIEISLEKGNLTVSAVRHSDNSEKDDAGNLIRQERSYGSFSRTFYVGEALTEEDIKAKYENGELKILLPKKTERRIESKKSILID